MTKKKTVSKNAKREKTTLIKIAEKVGEVAGRIMNEKDQLVEMAGGALDSVKTAVQHITVGKKVAVKKATVKKAALKKAAVKKVAKKVVKKVSKKIVRPAVKNIKKAVSSNKATVKKKLVKKAVKKNIKIQ